MSEARYTYRGEHVGRGLHRATWYSLCSRHQKVNRDGDCKACMAGTYVNDLGHRIETWVAKRHYKLWYWWANRLNSRHRRDIERWFPKLRRRG